MRRLVRTRSGIAALGLVVIAVAAAIALLSGRTALGAALAVLDLAVASALVLVAVVRLEWLQRTHHRALRELLGTQASEPGIKVPAPVPASGKRTAAGPSIGRDAARSPVGRPRAALLAELGFGGTPGEGDAVRPRVAGIVTDGLAAALDPIVDLVRIQPWLAVERLEELMPSCLVLDEHALRAGAWFGVEGTTTLGLTTALEEVLAWCRRADVPVLGLRADGAGGVHTPVMRSAYGLGFPAPEEELSPHGIPVGPLHRALQEYATSTAAGRS